jgi:hypothetical protein
VSDIGEIIANIKDWSRKANKITKLLDAYEKLHVEAFDNTYILEQKITEIEKAISSLPDLDKKGALDAWLKAEKASLGKFKEDFRFRFGQQLKELLSRDGIKIRGQYPLLRFGLFTLKLNFEFGDATLFFGPEVERIKSKLPLQPQVIYDAVRRYEQDIQDKDFDANTVMGDLVAAYKRCLAISGKSYGDKVRITEVFKEYVFLKQPKQFMINASRGNFREFSRIKLSYMLYRLRIANINGQGMRLHVATFDATVDKVRSFWVPDNAEGDGTHYEYISFEAARK